MPKGRKVWKDNRRLVPHPDDKKVAVDLPLQEKLMGLAEALSNPMDLRTPEELVEDYGISMEHYRRLQTDPAFLEPIVSKFYRSLSGAQMFVLKKLLRQVDEGNVAAARLTLQAFTGELGDGVKVNVLNVGGGGGGEDFISKLSDVELDREIHRLLMDTTPDDVTFVEGKILPCFDAVFEEEVLHEAKEVLHRGGDVDEERLRDEVSADDQGTGVGRGVE